MFSSRRGSQFAELNPAVESSSWSLGGHNMPKEGGCSGQMDNLVTFPAGWMKGREYLETVTCVA